MVSQTVDARLPSALPRPVAIRLKRRSRTCSQFTGAELSARSQRILQSFEQPVFVGLHIFGQPPYQFFALVE
jgi:hypothetical protein